MNFELNQGQEQHMKTLEWLLDIEKNNGSGRTHLMAVTFIKLAQNKPGKWIKVFDHYPGTSIKKGNMMIRYLKSIISNDKKLMKKTEFKDNEFRIRR